MAIQYQERHGGKFQIENFLADNVAGALTLAANGDLVEITGNFENGDIIHIAEPSSLAGDYAVTQYDGNTDLGYKALFGLTADDLDGVDLATIKGYKLEMLPVCWATDLDLDFGSWQTEEQRNGCTSYTVTTGFERGEQTVNFKSLWREELQLALMQNFQETRTNKSAPSVVFTFEPLGTDEKNQKALVGIQRSFRSLLTGLTLSEPNDGASTGTATFKITSQIDFVRLA